MLKKILLVVVLLIVGNGCSALSSLNSNNSYCNIADPILISDTDFEVITDDLVNDLLVHNEVYEKLCDE